ncbi:MAG: NAD(P)-dependent glycerol-3-phosphate dehydrogenase [Myxococcales bacterium]|nr:NAD(P)-dependent glycerol-3-phosphate dehydrogenase [Myxococcales bacterium]MDH5306973.1 NAD(P)-dependent glycerol-3-phosphate dehydrogenase [Myxococcales bacterium]MDH5565689.1 NAD(P)-dependent glycerol-3-phosphate dehydrogenase [Myxococcales bacterium]
MAIPIGVLGAGSFGTCLALLCAREHDVALWARNPEIADAINREHRNPQYLSDVALPPQVRATADLSEALADQELVICAVPSHGVRDVMGRAARFLSEEAIVVSTVKGIEVGTWMLMHQVLEDVLGVGHQPRMVFLSGPSFAQEVAERRPTAVTLACAVESYAISVQESISTPWFRCYTHTDVVGTEVAGALKNVIAIAVGICDGLDLGQNARAALMTRGLRETSRLAVQLGADPMTALGLAGVGDLILTCTGDLSRNRRVGLELARGRELEEIVSGMKQVAEGVRTTRAACALAELHGVEMPICQGIRMLLDGELSPKDCVDYLMTRQLRNETE